MPNAPSMKVGSKAQVFHGTAERTAGGLRKGDLMQTAAGRIVSKKQHEQGKKAINRLRAAGYVAKKGEFKLFTKKAKASSKKSNSPKKANSKTRKSGGRRL
jgi:hypothetical protein